MKDTRPQWLQDIDGEQEMLEDECLRWIEYYRRQKKQVEHEIAQAEKHARFWERTITRMSCKWQALDDKQWPLLCERMGIKP